MMDSFFDVEIDSDTCSASTCENVVVVWLVRIVLIENSITQSLVNQLDINTSVNPKLIKDPIKKNTLETNRLAISLYQKKI